MPSPLRLLGLAFVLALALAAGCHGSSAPREAEKEVEVVAEPEPPTEEVLGVADEASPGLLLWARDTAGEALSFRIDDSGQILERFEGVRIEIDGAEWRWQEQRIPLGADPSAGCGEGIESGGEGEDANDDQSFVTRATMARADESVSQAVVLPPIYDDEGADVEHIVKLVRSLGPLLFVRQSTYAYGCGAHGNLGASALVWDVMQNREIDLDQELSPIEGLRARAERILGEADDALVTDGDEVTLSELLPSFTEAGELDLKLRFTGFACYACSDGEWSSYTKSVLLPAPKLPKSLAPHAEVPAAVRAFVKSHPELELGGFSAPDISAARPAAGIAR